MTFLRPHNWPMAEAGVVCTHESVWPKGPIFSNYPQSFENTLNYKNDPCLQQDYTYVGERDKLLK